MKKPEFGDECGFYSEGGDFQVIWVVLAFDGGGSSGDFGAELRNLCLRSPPMPMMLPIIGFGPAPPQGRISWVSPLICPCRLSYGGDRVYTIFNSGRSRNPPFGLSPRRKRRKRWRLGACMVSAESGNPNLNIELLDSAKKSSKAQKILVSKRLSDDLRYEEAANEQLQLDSKFTNYQEDPLVDKLRSQLGVIHPIPSPPINRNIMGFFVLFFFVGVAFDKLWTMRKKNKAERELQNGTWPQVPTSFSLFLERDLQRKESVEWVNMVLGKLWKVYRSGIENWISGLLQPVIDDLKKPDYVNRVEIKQFSLGDDPLSVRNVERRTSRRVNDLQ